MVSEAFSKEIGFCLKMTLPFFSSAMGFLGAVVTVVSQRRIYVGQTPYWTVSTGQMLLIHAP